MGDILAPLFRSPEFRLVSQLCWLFFVVFSLALIFWTWRDASKRGAMAWFWALVVAFFNIAGWAVYMVVRPPEFLADVRERDLEIRAKEIALQRDMETCSSCLRPVERDFLICPACLKKLRKQCTECGRALKLEWGVCPYCKTKQ